MSKLLKTMKAVANLPADCWQLIFSYLSDSDLKAVSFVCKEFLTYVNLFKQSLKVIHPKVSMLSMHLKRFTETRNIDLRSFSGDIDGAILEIARSEIGLEALDVSQKAIRTEALKELGSNSKMKNLKVLNFHEVDYLQNDDFVVIANSFPNLEEFIVGYSYHGGTNPPQFPIDYGVEVLASNLKLLNKIHIFGKHIIVSDQSLVALSVSCVFLKDVRIYCNNSVTEYGIGLLLRNRPNLEALSTGYVKMNPSQPTITIESSISHAKALTSLEFFNMDVSDKLLEAIAKAKLPLKKLRLKYCYEFTVTGLLMVLTNHQLTELRIIASMIGDEDMKLLLSGDVSKLTRIVITQCQVTISTFFLLSTKCPSLAEITMSQVINGENNIPLSKNNKLQYLDLDLFRIRDDTFEQLGFIFPNLRCLDLSFCNHITRKAIEAILKSCKFLRKLIVKSYREAKFIEAGNSELPEVNLEDLTLSNSLIDDEGLADIAKICHRLVSLDLSCSYNLRAEGVKQIIKNITTLNCLYIRRNECINLRDDLFVWMLSTGNLASLKRIHIGENYDFSKEQQDELLKHGCLLLKW